MWEMPEGEKLAGLGMGKPNAIITLHLSKAASKSSRFDKAALRKRSSVRGDSLVEVKPGNNVITLSETWSLDKFINMGKMKK